jgi:hypothetical protein
VVTSIVFAMDTRTVPCGRVVLALFLIVMAALTIASYEWTVWPRMQYRVWKGKSYLKAKLD